jgi:NADPH:quinone reductase-like Zn-dependent oxidoreductase
VLEVVELPTPEPGEGEVRIRVAAATVNPTDIGLRSGNAAAALADKEAPFVPGMEAAGTIDAVGSGTSWSVGDEVMAIVVPQRTGRGAQSEYVVVPAASVAKIPSNASLVEAATIPMNGLTVRRALDLLALEPGSTLLVTGAAGAVGSYGVELGKADGLNVIASASASDKETVLGFGATTSIEPKTWSRLSARSTPTASMPSSTRQWSVRRSSVQFAMAASSQLFGYSTARPSATSPSSKYG